MGEAELRSQESLGLSVDLGEALHEPALAASGGVLVDDSFSGSFVDSLDCNLQGVTSVVGSGLSRRYGYFDASLQLGANILVSDAALFILLVAFDLALDVGHDEVLLTGVWNTTTIAVRR